MDDCYVVEVDTDDEESVEIEDEYQWSEEHEMLAQQYEITGIPKRLNTALEIQVARRLKHEVFDYDDVYDYFSYFIAEGIVFEVGGENSFNIYPTHPQWKQINAAIARGKELGFHRLSSRGRLDYARASVRVGIIANAYWFGWYCDNKEAEGIDWDGNVVEVEGERPDIYYDIWGPILVQALSQIFGSPTGASTPSVSQGDKPAKGFIRVTTTAKGPGTSSSSTSHKASKGAGRYRTG
ncbi:hypothetical protein KIPB_002904 [Kipferlia bialata]|uniref:Uncharacterized protein n=1 Tax=Kipferlia bialata TaxID=797122 RepID=A0A9K3GFD5_9EUKA|nr:hypothetical protein KIPB_001671 [Kipferlia bialata]GIQ81869.1 hypothetical protein KIPB_002904 [Kipferlia bialata]|eukprot:g1671.t1